MKKKIRGKIDNRGTGKPVRRTTREERRREERKLLKAERREQAV